MRSLCERHGIGLKITAQVLKDQYGIWRCASHEVDPDLIAGLAPKLKGLLNAGDAARYLGTSIDVFRGLIGDGLLVPDYRFNDKMAGFSSTTLDAFVTEWCEVGKMPGKRRGVDHTPISIVARANRVRVSRLLMAARIVGTGLYRDRRKCGLAGVFIGNSDLAALVGSARSLAKVG